MKKSELEAHSTEYHARMDRARWLEREGLYSAAVECALSAWEYIDGMMQYERKYGNQEFTTIPAIELILDCSPLLLDFKSLDELERLLKEYRRIEKGTSVDLGEELTRARERLWKNHRLLNHLECNPDARQDRLASALGGEQDYWRLVAEEWEKMGLVSRRPDGGSYRLTLSTRLGEIISGKCPSCGQIAQAPKAMLFEELTCPACRTSVLFVLLSIGTRSGAEE